MLRKDIFFEKEEEDEEWLKKVDLVSEDKKGIIVPNSGYQYKYNGKEWQDELGLNLYDFHARMYDPTIGRTINQDPHAENYYHLSAYSFLNNNPLLYIDPDGRDFIIWYKIITKNKSGKIIKRRDAHFRYNGSNASEAPNSKFVRDVIKSHKYNVKNGGGDNTDYLVNNPDIDVHIMKNTPGLGHRATTDFGFKYIILWDSETGLQTAEGHVLSPATGLEHESDHIKSRYDNLAEHIERNKTEDEKYWNKEEKRVIQGSETKTSKANGEIPKKQKYSRFCYPCGGGRVRVEDPTSNKPIIPKMPEKHKLNTD